MLVSTEEALLIYNAYVNAINVCGIGSGTSLAR